MTSFDKSKVEQIEALLYNSYIHDANLESISYDSESESLVIEAFNSIFNQKFQVTFRELKVTFSIKGKDFGSSKTINSLSVEKDFSYLHNYLQFDEEYEQNTLYILFQMFSGDELHILCKEIIIEIT